MNNNKTFIEEICNLQKEKENLLHKIDIKYNDLKPRVREIRIKYKKVLNELRVEFNTRRDFYGFGECDVEICRITMYEQYFMAETKVAYDDGEYDCEYNSVPYNPEDDAEYIVKFKEARRDEYIQKQAKFREDERSKYLELKKKFEG
jgi:hypothetical protein